MKELMPLQGLSLSEQIRSVFGPYLGLNLGFRFLKISLRSWNSPCSPQFSSQLSH